jgi:small subunit ribosomal protein S21
MLIIKVDKHKGIENSLKEYKNKVIKTRQSKEINKRKEFIKPSVIKRQKLDKAKYVEKKFN